MVNTSDLAEDLKMKITGSDNFIQAHPLPCSAHPWAPQHTYLLSSTDKCRNNCGASDLQLK